MASRKRRNMTQSHSQSFFISLVGCKNSLNSFPFSLMSSDILPEYTCLERRPPPYLISLDNIDCRIIEAETLFKSAKKSDEELRLNAESAKAYAFELKQTARSSSNRSKWALAQSSSTAAGIYYTSAYILSKSSLENYTQAASLATLAAEEYMAAAAANSATFQIHTLAGKRSFALARYYTAAAAVSCSSALYYHLEASVCRASALIYSTKAA